MQTVHLAWLFLLLAGIMEVGWAVSLKFTYGFSRMWPSLGTLACMGLSLFLFSLALKTIPVSTGYAVWTGIGAVGTALVGMWWLGEPREVMKILCILLIVAGIFGLKFCSS